MRGWEGKRVITPYLKSKARIPKITKLNIKKREKGKEGFWFCFVFFKIDSRVR